MMKWLRQAELETVTFKRVRKIFRGCIDHRKFAAFMTFSFIIFLRVLFVHILSLYIWLYVLYTLV